MDEKTIARFWSKVDKNGPTIREAIGPCWSWTGAKSIGGYGTLWTKTVAAHSWLAHRVSWRIEHGDWPTAEALCHRCDNRACVNPLHLFQGTRAENLADMRAKGRGSRPPRRIGAEHHATPFTETDVLSIRARVVAGESQSAIGREFGVSSNAINKIVLRRSWTHL